MLPSTLPCRHWFFPVVNYEHAETRGAWFAVPFRSSRPTLQLMLEREARAAHFHQSALSLDLRERIGRAGFLAALSRIPITSRRVALDRSPHSLGKCRVGQDGWAFRNRHNPATTAPCPTGTWPHGIWHGMPAQPRCKTK
jgi:hypothetical protein